MYKYSTRARHHRLPPSRMCDRRGCVRRRVIGRVMGVCRGMRGRTRYTLVGIIPSLWWPQANTGELLASSFELEFFCLVLSNQGSFCLCLSLKLGFGFIGQVICECAV